MIQQQTVLGEQIIPGAHGSALVASVSAPGGWHRVAYGQCDCKGYQYRGHCRHLVAVAVYNGLDREQALTDEAATSSPPDDGEYMTITEYLERRTSGRE
jgi:uncharacterized Zn finger protein